MRRVTALAALLAFAVPTLANAEELRQALGPLWTDADTDAGAADAGLATGREWTFPPDARPPTEPEDFSPLEYESEHRAGARTGPNATAPSFHVRGTGRGDPAGAGHVLLGHPETLAQDHNDDVTLKDRFPALRADDRVCVDGTCHHVSSKEGPYARTTAAKTSAARAEASENPRRGSYQAGVHHVAPTKSFTQGEQTTGAHAKPEARYAKAETTGPLGRTWFVSPWD